MSRKILYCFLLVYFFFSRFFFFFTTPGSFPPARSKGRKKKTFITKDSSKLEVNEWDELLFYMRVPE